LADRADGIAGNRHVIVGGDTYACFAAAYRIAGYGAAGAVSNEYAMS